MKFWLKSLKGRTKERVSMWIAWHLPKYIVLWCAYRVAAHAVSGKWENEEVPSVTMMDAIARWADTDE